jgi:predicted transcriptional regulator
LRSFVFFCILLASTGRMEPSMSKTITLRLDDPVYRLLKDVAERENRPISNFIVTAVMRFVHDRGMADEFEMAEIRGNAGLSSSLKRGHRDAKNRRGSFA